MLKTENETKNKNWMKPWNPKTTNQILRKSQQNKKKQKNEIRTHKTPVTGKIHKNSHSHTQLYVVCVLYCMLALAISTTAALMLFVVVLLYPFE